MVADSAPSARHLVYLRVALFFCSSSQMAQLASGGKANRLHEFFIFPLSLAPCSGKILMLRHSMFTKGQ